jgi:hypothetical protein
MKGARRNTRRMAVVAMVLSAFAVVPVTVTTAHAGEASAAVAQQASWKRHGIHTHEWCVRIGQDAQREFGWPYRCRWFPPIAAGYMQLELFH